MKNTLNFIRQRKLAQRLVLLAIMPAMTVLPDFARANPTNGTVTHGFAEINTDIEGHLQIFQHSDKAIINWEDFSIAPGEMTEFIQSGAGATALSRVTSGNPSAIFGTLKANGGHILINPNGIMVGATGVVDVAGMNVLSTLDIDDADFLSGGDMVFRGTTAAGVTNFGTISSSEGDVILLGNYVDNQGSLGAVQGTVALGAGGEILLGSAGDAKISILSAGAGGNTGINNAGSITAAAAELKAHGNVYALAVNNTGTIRATGVERVNGRVVLSAGDPGGPIVNTGDVSAVNADGSGGMVEVNAGPVGSVDLLGGSIKADGAAGQVGGSVLVTGQTVNVAGAASVTANGETGGSVTVGSPEFTSLVTTEAGTVISANGAGGAGGSVVVQGTPDSVMTLGGNMNADGADGGSISVAGGNITQGVNSTLSANGENNGGVIGINGANLVLNGSVLANGVNGDGGQIAASATENLSVGSTGVISTNGGVNGGLVEMTAGGDALIEGTITADGLEGNGGTVMLDAEGAMDVSGAVSANGGDEGVGGLVAITGDEVIVRGTAAIGASGGQGGGGIFVGGPFQGKGDTLRKSSSTTVEAGATFNADSTIGGNAGAVVIWSDGDTFFEGDISAQALGATGRGGLVEVSGLNNLTFRGNATADTVLFDPGDVVVGDGSSDIPIANVNTILQGGTSVVVLTEDGDITFANIGLQNDRNDAIQWTNSDASFGAFAGGNIFINTHIRTSGGGSINLIAGWTGLESDFEDLLGVGANFGAGADDNPSGGREFISTSGLANVEAIWEGYVESGDFGNGGSVFMGASDLNRAINVGSRFGNTNVAAANLIMTTPQTVGGDTSESDWVHLGFRDTGAVFAVRGTNGFGNGQLDLNNRAFETDNDPIVAILPIDEATGLLDLTSPLLVDLNGDGIYDGVRAVNSSGILDGTNTIDIDSHDSNNNGIVEVIGGLSGDPGPDPINNPNPVIPFGFDLDFDGNGNGEPDISEDFLTGGTGAMGPDGIPDITQVDGSNNPLLVIIEDLNGDGVADVRTENQVYDETIIGFDLNNDGDDEDTAVTLNANLGLNGGFDAGHAQNRDVNGDTVVDRIALIDVTGDGITNISLYDTDSDGVVDHVDDTGTFISFANHFMSERVGNWWWQQIDAQNPDPQGLGSLLPEHGAGQSETARADINVVTTGAVLLNSGGRNQNYAQIGHGGDATAWADDRGLRDGNLSNNISNQTGRNFTYNGARQDRGGNSIGRLAGVYGNINVLAGVNPGTVQYNSGALTNNLTADIISPGGIVRLEGWQNPEDSVQNNTNNINNVNQSSEAYVQIGHLGTGQFGSVTGDIVVRAGGDVDILAGAHNRSHASIGHTMNAYSEWNVTDNPEQQLRFFANTGDLDNPNLRKGELFLHENGIDSARGFYEEGTQSERWDDDFYDVDGDTDDGINTAGAAVTGTAGSHAGGPVHVSGMVGSTRKDIVGDITVESGGGITIKAYSTPDTRTQGTTVDTIRDIDGDGLSAQLDGTDDPDDADGYTFNRDRRFAGIGHGGTSFDVWGENDNERVRLSIANGDEITGSTSVEVDGVDGDTRIGRATTFVNLLGDIEVHAYNGDIVMHAGNDTFDHAYIGHGGSDLSDFETSNVVIGDINVSATGDLEMAGGAIQADFTGNDDRDFFSYVQIGHHGRENGLQYYAGNIDVSIGGGIELIGGRYRESGAKIGHQSNRGFGQVSGEFSRTEQFLFGPAIDGGSPIITQADVTATDVTIQVDLNGNGTYEGDEEIKTFSHSGYTSNISVEAGANGGSGDILLTHAEPGQLVNQNQYAFNNDGNDNDIRWSPTQIGHGGRETTALRNNGGNAAYNYSAKVGDVSVTAGGIATVDDVTGITSVTGGNITLQGGEGPQGWWTVIGHALGNNDRANGPDDLDNSFIMAGDVTVNAFNNLFLDGQFADQSDPTNVNLPGEPGSIVGAPADQNHVGIGHQGSWNNLDVVVLDSGDVKGITDVSSDIDITVGNNLDIVGGNGTQGSQAQIGHGFNSDTGNDAARPSGFSGDITVNVGNNATLTGSPNAAVREPSLTATYLPVEGAAAVIGHGGHQLDADLSGDITVYVGNLGVYNGDLGDYEGNLLLQGSQRTEGEATDTLDNPLGSAFNFAKIGHWSTELDAASGRADVVGNVSGDITVVVANDLNLNGGTTAGDYATEPLVFAFAQIGNGGPGVAGTKEGDITVLVGNDFTTTDGVVGQNANNYTMIGNGDWVRDGSAFVLPSTGGPGTRQGNITVAAGHSIDLDHTLIGHADPDILPSATTILDGNTYIAVSRNFPFFGNGTLPNEIDGTFEARNDTVITSAFYGLGSELRIYIPDRDSNLVNAGDLRLNEASATYIGTPVNFGPDTPGDGSVFDASLGEFAGREDEVYLQPDLWWDNQMISKIPGGSGFPATLGDVQGGGIATVDDPGGIPNLVLLAAGSLGSGTTTYREGNGVSGIGNYTFYYDAIQNVRDTVGGGGAPSPSSPAAPVEEVVIPFVPVVVEVEEVVPVPTPFNYLPFLFIDKFDSFDRDDIGLDSGTGNIFEGFFSLFNNKDEEGLKEGDPVDALFGFGEGSEEESEENVRRRRGSTNSSGKSGAVYYVYSPSTGKYSSYREFGIPASSVTE